MSYDLRHHMHVYEQLFGSAERVTELIMTTNWEESSAPPKYLMDAPDHLYVIANTFNLCVVFLARSESTTVLPLLVDGCPLPPLQVQWEYHRDIRVSGWAAPYRNRTADWVTRYNEMCLESQCLNESVPQDVHPVVRLAACLLRLDRVGGNTLPKTELSQNPIRHVRLYAVKICNEPMPCGNATITNILSLVRYPPNLISCHHIQSQANI
ncbi:hypothetical protein M9H77_06809 [Catharanthus roseus]|uniref:Uncharacterized protein n=1 Tax=Catharanthus roseus TaxID=4058 RepID=A0ACC0BT55_CATRO|nr:hypothetical protein M9H77_06809 [Catharanthus roseus]